MDLKFVIEAILFTAQKPLNARELREILSTAAEKAEEEEAKAFKKVKEDELTAALEQLGQEHAQSGRSYYLACVAGSWQFVTRPEYMPWLKALFGVKSRPPRLSQPALETLAIVAYRQPITRAEMEQIRGVAVDGVVATLLERGLLENAGRAEVVGRPMMYATTQLFLEYFGLRSLDELPAAEELRRIPVQKPESLLTVAEGLATAAPEDLQGQPPAPEAGETPPPSQADASPDLPALGATQSESSAASPEPAPAEEGKPAQPEPPR